MQNVVLYIVFFFIIHNLRFSETSLGITLNNEPNIQKYKEAVNNFGELFAFRLVRPWLRIKPLYNWSDAKKRTDENVKVLHDFSSNVIRKRKEYFENNKGQSYSERKRMAMLDLLLQARHNEGIDIDDAGIREEVDTFMFEVNIYYNFNCSVYIVSYICYITILLFNSLIFLLACFICLFVTIFEDGREY